MHLEELWPESWCSGIEVLAEAWFSGYFQKLLSGNQTELL